MNPTGHIQTIHLDTADDFIKELSSTGKRFGGGYYPGGWLYRGHADARWPLLPTALRQEVFLGVGEWVQGPRSTNLEQIKAETKLALHFFRMADNNGLPLPEDSQKLRRALEALSTLDPRSPFIEMLKIGKEYWPPDELLSLFALAQHHGLPTRLLDWTENVYVAAYFAAEKASRWLFKLHSNERRGATHLCIWAITRSVFEVREILAMLTGPSRMILVTTPSAGNPNLRAQTALFLVDRPKQMDPDAPVDTRPWDVLLQEALSYMKRYPILQQLCLPIEEAPRLLRLLAFERINAATVFPGFDGVVSALKEQRYWEGREEAGKRRLTVDSV
jgi:hypothetical protein